MNSSSEFLSKVSIKHNKMDILCFENGYDEFKSTRVTSKHFVVTIKTCIFIITSQFFSLNGEI